MFSWLAGWLLVGWLRAFVIGTTMVNSGPARIAAAVCCENFKSSVETKHGKWFTQGVGFRHFFGEIIVIFNRG